MFKTTLYLPEELKASLARLADEEGCSEAQIIRDAIRAAIDARRPPQPRLPLGVASLGDPTAAERADELLAGFGRP